MRCLRRRSLRWRDRQSSSSVSKRADSFQWRLYLDLAAGHLPRPNGPAYPGKSEASSSAETEAFFETRRFCERNKTRARRQGRLPTLVTSINGEKMASLDTVNVLAEGYDAEAVATLLGPASHIARKVHDSGQGDHLKAERWLLDADCC